MKRWVMLGALLFGTSISADKLEDAGQLLVDHGLETWEKGDVAGARDSFARARDLLPDKPNPYRLLALADSKLGRCQEARSEAERFFALTPASDPRRVEVAAIRDSCAPPVAAPAASVPPGPNAASARPMAAPPPSRHLLRNLGIASIVGGVVLLAVGIPLLALNGQCTDKRANLQQCPELYDTNGVGAPFVAFGSAGLVASIPLLVVGTR